MAAWRKGFGASEMPHADERWLITYADMITLLLAVFIVLFALSDTNFKKFTAFAQSLAQAFNTDVLAGSDAYTVTSGEVSSPDTPSIDAGGVVSADLRSMRAAIRDFVIGQGLDSSVDVAQVPEGIAIRISDSLLFQSGRAVLGDRSLEVLGRIARVIGGLPNDIRVEGHTDDLPPDGILFKDNWDLSSARALAVLRTLHAAGIDDRRLAAAGYAQFRPLTTEMTPAARRRNRRVDILLLYPQAGGTGNPGASPIPGGVSPFPIP